MGDNNKKPRNPYSGMQFFNSGVPHSRPDSTSSSNSGQNMSGASPSRKLSSSSIKSEKNSGTPPPASIDSSPSHNNHKTRDGESPSNESSSSINGEIEMSENNERLTPQHINSRPNSRPVSTSSDKEEGNPEDPTARTESNSSNGEENNPGVSPANIESSSSSREEIRPQAEPLRNESSSSVTGAINGRGPLARPDSRSSNNRDGVPAQQPAQVALRAAPPPQHNGRHPKFDTPLFNANITVCGDRVFKEQVEQRAREIGGNWKWMINGCAYNKLFENYEYPLPLQVTAAASMTEGLDTWIGIDRGQGRTTSWMAYVSDRIMCSQKVRGAVRHIVVADTADLISKIATQFNLIVPYDDRDQRMIDTVWYWAIDKKQSIYRELRDKGADILFTTLSMLPSILRDPPFDPNLVETLVVDEFPINGENSRWWLENIMNYFAKDTQSIIVGRHHSHFNFAPDILRKNYVVISSIVVAPTVPPRQDFVVALTVREEAEELIHTMETLNAENNRWPMAIFVDKDDEADAIQARLVERGFGNSLGRLPRKLVDRENWRITMNRYRRGQVQILICAYDADKLIDIPGQSDIFFGLPFRLEWFQSRLNRVARVRSGRTVTILREHDQQKIPDVRKILSPSVSQQLGNIERSITNRARQYERRNELEEDIRRNREELARLEARLQKANNAIDDAVEETRQINIIALN